jgi:hypothetical protein
MEKIVKEFNKLFKGREFVYKSKYGRTRGIIVDSIYVTETFILDEDSEKTLGYRIDHSVKGTKTMEKPEQKGTEFYMASRPEFMIRSTKGNIYKLDECFFINNKEDEGSF